ncbi:hypothetical protein QEG_3109, partial [Clostridioides difficile CD127]
IYMLNEVDFLLFFIYASTKDLQTFFDKSLFCLN